MKFKKGDLVFYKYPNCQLSGKIGVVLRDSEGYRTEIHFANVAKFKTQYILNNGLKCASK